MNYADPPEDKAVPAIDVVNQRSWQGSLSPPSKEEMDFLIANSIEWAKKFYDKNFVDKNGDPKELSENSGETALDYAWKKFEWTEHYINETNAKDDALLRLAGIVAVAQIGLVKALGLAPNNWFMTSFSLIVLCIVTLMYARTTRMGYSLSEIDETLEPLFHSGENKWWLAASLNTAVRTALPFAKWRMRLNNLATWLFIGSVFVMIPTAMTLKPTTPSGSPRQAEEETPVEDAPKAGENLAGDEAQE